MSLKYEELLVSGGLVTGMHMLSLAYGLQVQGRFLVDEAVGARHELHPSAAFLVRRLQTPLQFGEWLELCRRRHIKPAEIQELLYFLNSIGGLKIDQRGYRVMKVRFRLLCMLYGMSYVGMVRRRPVGVRGVAALVSAASVTVWLLAWLTVPALLLLGLPIWEAVVYPMVTFLLFWSGTVAHESMHGLFVATGSAVVLQKGLRVGVLHQPLGTRRDVLSALGGPIAGAVVVLLVTFCIVEATTLDYVVGIAWLLMFAQLWSLMPWYGDGKVVWDKVRRYRGSVRTQ